MNQKIQDLMYHSGLTAQGCWDEMDEYDKQAIEKFAELIVKECIRIDEENRDAAPGVEIAKHFGVEE